MMEYTGFNNQVNKITNYETMIGNSIMIQTVGAGSGGVRGDLQVDRMVGTTLWGRVKDHYNHCVEGQEVKLLKLCENEDGQSFKVIAVTTTDANGNYHFDAYGEAEDRYNILIESQDNKLVEIQPQQVNYQLPKQTQTGIEEPAYDCKMSKCIKKGTSINHCNKFYGNVVYRG